MSELVIQEDGIYEKVDTGKLVKEITDKVMEMIDERSKSTDSK